jgi:hypothetical protein
VEGAPQRGQLLAVARIVLQCAQRRLARAHHLAGLVQEDAQQVVVIVLGHRRGRGQFQGRGPARHLHGLQLQRRAQQGIVPVPRGLGRAAGGLRQRRALVQRGLGRHPIELRRRARRLARLAGGIERIRWRRAAGRGRLGGAAPAHETEFVARLVVDEQLARQGRLVAQHVDQKAQRPQAAASFSKTPSDTAASGAAASRKASTVAHARDGQCRLVQPSTDSTPRICASWSGTASSRPRSAGCGKTDPAAARPRPG